MEHRDFEPFVTACQKRGIGKTTAYRLLAEGLLETFTIGTKRFVFIDSLLSLPERLKTEAGEQVAA